MNNIDPMYMFMMWLWQYINVFWLKKINGEIFNVGSNNLNHKIKDLALLVAKNNKKSKIEIKKLWLTKEIII